MEHNTTGYPDRWNKKKETMEPKEQMEHLSLQDRVLSIARSQMGFAEIPHGSNWGKHVKKYLNSVGINFPAAWCMAFVYWVFEEAAKEAALKNELVKTGGVLHQWNNVSKKYKSKMPLRGGVFIMDFGKGTGHTGIIEKVDGDYIHTIEGNTNDEGSREGYEVARRKRKISSCKGFINIIV